MELKVDFQGLPDLKKAFELLPERIGAKAASKAVRAGAKVIQKAARAKVPVNTGNLRKSIIIKVLNRKRTGLQVTALIGPGSGRYSKKTQQRTGDGFYGFFVEYGTKAHLIKAKNKKELASTFGKFFGTEVHHPGAPFKPFMRPAFDEHKAEAQRVIMTVILEAIEVEARKLYGGK